MEELIAKINQVPGESAVEVLEILEGEDAGRMMIRLADDYDAHLILTGDEIEALFVTFDAWLVSKGR